MFFERAVAMLKIRRSTIEIFSTIRRPQSSDKGAVKSGQIAHAKTNRDTVSERSTEFVICKSSDTFGMAGAIIDEDSGETNAYIVTTITMDHFLKYGQFLGFSGSSSESQVTSSGSTSKKADPSCNFPSKSSFGTMSSIYLRSVI